MSMFSKRINRILSEARVTRDENGLFVKHMLTLKKYYKDPECMTLHRENGPAIESTADKRLNKYYLEGRCLPEAEWIVRTVGKKSNIKLTDNQVKDIEDLFEV